MKDWVNSSLNLLKNVLFSNFLFLISFYISSNQACFASNSATIGDISFENLELINRSAMLDTLPRYFKPGRVLNSDFTPNQIVDIVHKTGFFESVKIFYKHRPGKIIDFKLIFKEKKMLMGHEVLGNFSSLGAKKIASVIDLNNLKMICQHDLGLLTKKINDEYRKKAIFNSKIELALSPHISGNPNEVFLTIKIEEGAATVVRNIEFVGCKQIESLVLRKHMLTREIWPFYFVNNSGLYNREMIDADKQIVSSFYSDHGFYDAKIKDVLIKQSPEKKEIDLTFIIEEGERYKVRLISFPESENGKSANYLRKIIPLKRGDYFSRAKLGTSVERIRESFAAGNFLFCDVFPEVLPGKDKDGVPYIDINFFVEKGEKVKIRDIKITGNQKTRDYVVRREISVLEGDFANKLSMDRSLRRLEALGYFDPTSLDWKIIPSGKDVVDLELNLKEVKTGSANFMWQLRSSAGSSAQGAGSKMDASGIKGDSFAISLTGNVKKRNLFGLGWDVNGNVSFSGTRFSGVEFDFFNPALFNQNLCLGFKFYGGSTEYKDYHKFFVQTPPIEQAQGIAGSLGYYLFPDSARIRTSFDFGYDLVGYSDFEFNSSANDKFVEYLRNKLQIGNYAWLGLKFTKDELNHPLYPSSGWRSDLSLRLLPTQGGINQKFGMLKAELAACTFYPLVPRDRLVFSALAKLGMVTETSNDSTSIIPFRELFMFGGSDTLRGFRWGEAGPMDRHMYVPLGAKKMFLTRFELITPLSFEKDFDIGAPRFYLFCDIGCAWDTVKKMPTSSILNDTLRTNLIAEERKAGIRGELATLDLYKENDLIKNKFDLKTSLGFGLKLTTPQPIKVEWGFKLNKDRLSKERASEWHLCVNMPIEL